MPAARHPASVRACGGQAVNPRVQFVRVSKRIALLVAQSLRVPPGQCLGPADEPCAWPDCACHWPPADTS
jgi:hypothetical protein